MKQIRKRLTYANVMSSLAVFLVLGGATAFAATKIGGNEIKANAISTGKIKKEAVSTSKIKKNAVDSSRVKDGSLTGADISLGTLGTVPSATNATNAVNAGNANTVGGQSVVSFFKQVATNGPEVTVVDVGGVKLTATCAAGKPSLVSTKSSGEAAASRFGNIEETAEVTGNGQSSFSTLELTKKPLGSGTLEVVFASGKVTTIDYAWRDDAFSGGGCRFFGHAIAG